MFFLIFMAHRGNLPYFNTLILRYFLHCNFLSQRIAKALESLINSKLKVGLLPYPSAYFEPFLVSNEAPRNSLQF